MLRSYTGDQYDAEGNLIPKNVAFWRNEIDRYNSSPEVRAVPGKRLPVGAKGKTTAQVRILRDRIVDRLVKDNAAGLSNAAFFQPTIGLPPLEEAPEEPQDEIDHIEEPTGFVGAEVDRPFGVLPAAVGPPAAEREHKDEPREEIAGEGKNKHRNGLYDTDLDRIMDMHPEFAAVIARDEIKKILPMVEPGKKIAWIWNLDTHEKPGSHWISVFIDPVGSKSIDYFDSFGREIPADMQKDVKLVVDLLKPKTFLKLKSNHVIHQKDDTSTCGFHAMLFILNRLRGKSFAEASGYNEVTHKIDKSKEYEAQIERLKKVPPFSLI